MHFKGSLRAEDVFKNLLEPKKALGLNIILDNLINYNSTIFNVCRLI